MRLVLFALLRKLKLRDSDRFAQSHPATEYQSPQHQVGLSDMQGPYPLH